MPRPASVRRVRAQRRCAASTGRAGANSVRIQSRHVPRRPACHPRAPGASKRYERAGVGTRPMRRRPACYVLHLPKAEEVTTAASTLRPHTPSLTRIRVQRGAASEQPRRPPGPRKPSTLHPRAAGCDGGQRTSKQRVAGSSPAGGISFTQVFAHSRLPRTPDARPIPHTIPRSRR